MNKPLNTDVAIYYSKNKNQTLLWNPFIGQEMIIEGNDVPKITSYHFDTNTLNKYEEIRLFDEPIHRNIKLSPTFFDIEFVALSEALSYPYNKIIFIGCPFDLNVTHKSGQKFAPDYLRLHSRFNYPTKLFEQIEKSYKTKIFDCGNVISIVPQRNGREQIQIEAIADKCIAYEAIPFFIGGDHSITYSILKGILANKEIRLIHFDAHYDYGNGVEIQFEDIHHGNFLDGLLCNNNLIEVLQVGQRMRKDNNFIPHKKVKEMSVEQFLAHCFTESEYYITFDVDVIDPSLISSTGTMIPFGMDLSQLSAVLRKLHEINLVGADVVEFLPTSKIHEGQLISEIIFKIMEAMIGVSTS
jgi:agmatinase